MLYNPMAANKESVCGLWLKLIQHLLEKTHEIQKMLKSVRSVYNEDEDLSIVFKFRIVYSTDLSTMSSPAMVVEGFARVNQSAPVNWYVGPWISLNIKF